MPPAYIVVNMRWDDPEDDLNCDNKDNIGEKIEEIEENLNNQNECIQNYWMSNTSLFNHRYRLVVTFLNQTIDFQCSAPGLKTIGTQKLEIKTVSLMKSTNIK